MSLDNAYNDVRKFHLAFKHNAPETPTRQTPEQAKKRGKWINDEVEELLEADTLVDQADAYLDILYFALGGLVELGIRPQPLFEIVQAANMAKLGPNGPEYHPDGKIKKPEGWVAPEPLLQKEVARQIRLGDNKEQFKFFGEE